MLTQIRFRDPPPVQVREEALRKEIARIVVGAPTLPQSLPRFGLTLYDVEPHPTKIGLRLRRGDEPFGTILVDWAEAAAEAAPAVTHRFDGVAHTRENTLLITTIVDRLRTAVAQEKWDSARERLEELNDLPRQIGFDSFRQIVPGVHGLEALVRTGFNCNQDCGMCWQGRTWGRVQSAQVLSWIEDLRAAGAARLMISGGEPTLDPALPSYIKRAREIGYDHVTLETNAIQFAKAGKVEIVRDAGLTNAFVSLHSGDSAVSDRVTRAPGTHVRTVRGIRALLDAGIRVALNCVITIDNIDTVAALPAFIHERYGDSPNLDALVVSDAGGMFDQTLEPRLVPHPDRMREVLPALIEGAATRGIQLQGLGGACGPHLCLFGADPRAGELRPIPGPVSFRTYLPACEGCSVKWACLGVREGHAKLYGGATVRPLTTPTATRAD